MPITSGRSTRRWFPPAGPLRWLLAADALLIAADILQRQGVLADSRFLVTHEAGFGEMFQYAKAAAACIWLAAIAARRRSLSALIWAVLLGIVLFDDSLELHERAGEFFAARLGLPSIGALRGNHLGELLFFGCLGVGCLIGLGLGWRFGDEEDHRLSEPLFVWFGALAFCAVVLDAVSSFTRRSRLGAAFGILEDGGEMIVLSLLVVAVGDGVRRAFARDP